MDVFIVLHAWRFKLRNLRVAMQDRALELKQI